MFDTSKILNINDITKRIGNFFKLPIQLFKGVSYPELAFINEACYHFAVAMSFMAFLNVQTYTSGGGGSSDNELPRKRDDLEEEIARARRCAEAARAKIGVVRKRGFRR